MKKVVFTFGRLNPPTIGHQKLVSKVESVAKTARADSRVYLSHTQNNKKDPLPYSEKLKLARKAFGSSVVRSNSKNIIQILKELESDGYTDIIMVVGSDRVPEFKRLLEKYNGKDYNFDSIEVVSAGERDPDADGVEGMSASKMRKLALDGEFETFRLGLPRKLVNDAQKIYDMIRDQLDVSEQEEVDEVEEALDVAQRRDLGRRMKRLAPKIARKRELAMKRRAPPEKLKIRANKKAIQMIRKKVAGDKASRYSELSPTEKSSIDKKVAKKAAAVNRLSKKLLPKVKKAETLRLSKKPVVKESREDKDIGDREGSQPAKYHTGLAKSTKQKRDTQFKKSAKKDSGDPSAYPDKHVGDSGVKTKLSKHTKKYRDMFGEEVTPSQIKDLEKFADRLLQKYDIDVEFTRHFADRMNDDRNSPKITIPELQRIFKKIHRRKGSEIKKHGDMEVVIQDMQSDLNLPVAINYKNGEFEVVNKTIMRKKDFKSSNKKIQYEEFELTEDSEEALKKKAEKSGIPYDILKKVYDRGMAAWRTGHRPGATQQQWAYARVNSFITGGKTRTTADADLWKKAKGMKEERDSLIEQLDITLDEAQSLSTTDLIDVLKSKTTKRKPYEAAKSILSDIIQRKRSENKGKLPHSVDYYAAMISRQFSGVNAKQLARLVSEETIIESKTIKVGEDAIRAEKTQYAVIKERKVTAVGKKSEMKEYSESNGGRVWLVSSERKVGDEVE